jgi:carboxypeptidase PM20D1
LVLVASDSRHYAQLGWPCYRFSPLWLRTEDVSRIHGVNERIAVDHYARAVEFYVQLIRAPV